MNQQSPPDAELVTLALSGDQKGFEGLVDRYLPSLIGFFRYLRVPPGQIDDLVQETFTKALGALKQFDTSRPFLPWLVTIGRNHFLRQARLSKREQSLPEDWDLPDPGRVEEQAVTRQSLGDILRKLPEEARFLVELRIFQDLPFQEIAQITGQSEGALRVRYHRILQLLRTRFPKEEAI